MATFIDQTQMPMQRLEENLDKINEFRQNVENQQQVQKAIELMEIVAKDVEQFLSKTVDNDNTPSNHVLTTKDEALMLEMAQLAKQPNSQAQIEETANRMFYQNTGVSNSGTSGRIDFLRKQNRLPETGLERQNELRFANSPAAKQQAIMVQQVVTAQLIILERQNLQTARQERIANLKKRIQQLAAIIASAAFTSRLANRNGKDETAKSLQMIEATFEETNREIEALQAAIAGAVVTYNLQHKATVTDANNKFKQILGTDADYSNLVEDLINSFDEDYGKIQQAVNENATKVMQKVVASYQEFNAKTPDEEKKAAPTPEVQAKVNGTITDIKYLASLKEQAPEFEDASFVQLARILNVLRAASGHELASITEFNKAFNDFSYKITLITERDVTTGQNIDNVQRQMYEQMSHYAGNKPAKMRPTPYATDPLTEAKSGVSKKKDGPENDFGFRR